MSKGGGSAPPAVDPMALGQAQAESNVATAAAQAALNNVNTTTPFGSSTFSAYGQGPNGIGPAGYNLNTNLSGPVAGVFNNQTTLAQALTGNAGAIAGLTASPAGAGTNLIDTAYNVWSPQLPTGPVSTEGLPDLQSSVNPSYYASSFAPGSIDFNNAPLSFGVNPGYYNQFSLPNSIDYNNLPGYTSSVNGGPIQSGINFSGLNPLNPGSASELVSSPGSAGNVGPIGQAENAAYGAQAQYLDPQFAQKERDLTQQLADQGIGVGTDAYSRARGDLGRQEDLAYQGARDTAVAAGQQEQNTLFGQQLGARQQGAAETEAAGNFANAAQAQNFGEGTTNAGLENTLFQTIAQQREKQAAYQAGAQGQAFGEGKANAEIGNAAAAEAAAQDKAQAAYQAQLEQQRFGEGLTNAQLSDQARQQALNERITQWGEPLTALSTAANTGEGILGSTVSNLTGLSPLMDFSQTGVVPTTIGNTQIAPANIVGAGQVGAQSAMNRFLAGNTLNNQLFNGIGSLGGVLFGQNGSGLFGSGGLLGSGGSGGLLSGIFGGGGADAGIGSMFDALSLGASAGGAADLGAGAALAVPFLA